MKPSENTPLVLLRLCDLIKEAGYPAGAMNLLNGYGNTVGQALSEHHGIDKISFTGSTAVGRRIAEASAKTNLKACTLELGGKSPNIIFDDADLDQAIKWTENGIYGNAGQCLQHIQFVWLVLTRAFDQLALRVRESLYKKGFTTSS